MNDAEKRKLAYLAMFLGVVSTVTLLFVSLRLAALIEITEQILERLG